MMRLDVFLLPSVLAPLGQGIITRDAFPEFQDQQPEITGESALKFDMFVGDPARVLTQHLGLVKSLGIVMLGLGQVGNQ